MSIKSGNRAGYGLGIAAFVISILNLLLFLVLVTLCVFVCDITPRARMGLSLKTKDKQAIESKEIGNLADVKSHISDSDKDMIYQTVRGSTVKKNKKIDSGKEIAKLVWVAIREYYNTCGRYPFSQSDIFGIGAVPPGLNISQPPGDPYFIYNILDHGIVEAQPNTNVDPSLADVTNIIIGIDGRVTGGEY